MSICDEMTNRPDRLEQSYFDRALELFGKALGHTRDYLENYRARLERREAFKTLYTLDQRTLDDIGITANDVSWAAKLPIDQNAAVELQKVRYARLNNKK